MAAPRVFVEVSDDDLVKFSKENEYICLYVYLILVLHVTFIYVFVRSTFYFMHGNEIKIQLIYFGFSLST